jgi:O-antigen/teichoic acid export membrane protein
MTVTRPKSAETLAKGTFFGLVADALILPTGIVSAALLTRTLGVELYGLIGVVVAASSTVAWIIASIFGMRSGVKIVSDAEDPIAAASTLLRLNILAGGTAAVIFAVAAPITASLLGQPDTVTALRLAAVEILLMPIARSHRDALVATHSYTHSGLAGGVFHLARLVSIVIFLAFGFGIETVMCAMIAARIAEIMWCRQKLPIPFFKSYDLRTKGNLAAVAPAFIYSLSLRLFSSADILLLSAFGAATVVLSHYTAAQTLAQIPGMVNAIVAPGLIASLARSRREGNLALNRVIEDDTLLFAAVVSSFLLVVAGAAPGLFFVTFGGDFVGASVLFAWLIVGGIGAFLIGLASAFMIDLKRTGDILYVAIPMLVLGGLAWVLIIPVYGAVGAARVYAFGTVLGAIAAFALIPHLRIRAFQLLPPAILCGVAGGIVANGLAQQGLWGIDFLAGTCVTTLLLWVSGVADLRTFNRMIFSIWRRGAL